MYYLGVDIGGTTIKAGLVDDAGRLFEQSRIPTVTGDWPLCFSNLIALIRTFQSGFPLQSIGIGVPGLADSRTGRIRVSPNIPCLTDVSLGKVVADEVHVPVTVENDANAAAYGEFVCGLGIGLQHMAYLTLGTGVGSGVILNGALFRGTSGYAVEFGHTTIQPAGRACACGSSGCLESLASAGGILLTAQELMQEGEISSLQAMVEPLSSELIFEAARAGDPVAHRAFEVTGHWIGIACGNLINTLNPQLIAIGGGVMGAGDMLLNPVIAAAKRHSIAASFEDCRIVQSKLGPEAGVIGAAMLARDALTSPCQNSLT